VSLPGPSGLTWALELLSLAAGLAIAGELIRSVAARWVRLFRDLGGIERGFLDLYLGGAGLYVVAALPFGLFEASSVVAYLVGAGSILAVGRLWDWRKAPVRRLLPTRSAWLDWIPALLLLAVTGALFGIELVVAEGVPTGNSFDTSILADYVAILLLHHQLPVSLVPIAPQLSSYPQGTTVWLAAAQLIFSLPPARTPLLVTPLFLSLSPVAGYVLGQRLLRSRWAGLLVGLTFALLGSWTRVMVATSNDFVFSFPLVLWLLARSDLWRKPEPPNWPDAVAYGAVLGYSAALNPVGAEWLFPALVLFGLVAGLGRARYLRTAVPRWAAALVAALLFVAPPLWAIAEGRGALFASTGPVTVPAPTGAPGISAAQLVGSLDPFLFRPQDIWLSPFLALRLELAGLLVAGAAVLLVPELFRRLGARGPPFRQLVGGTILTAAGLLLLQVAAGRGLTAFDSFAVLSSAAEVSVYVFAIYTLLAALPLLILVEFVRTSAADRRTKPTDREPPPTRRSRPASLAAPRAIGLVLVVALLVPGVVVTGTDFPPYLEQLYGSFGRVSAGDFLLFAWAVHGIPTGARVLVAPGSAAQFLPGYANVQLLYPVQAIAANASYVELDRQLVQGQLNASGLLDLAYLDVQYIAVTGNTTDLWAPFSPAPLLANSTAFPVLFHSGDAYVFQVRG
jgi:hypothetical protein